ncbi:hypothetical protein ACLKA7_012699 [Drosophila subpalustris]
MKKKLSEEQPILRLDIVSPHSTENGRNPNLLGAGEQLRAVRTSSRITADLRHICPFENIDARNWQLVTQIMQTKVKEMPSAVGDQRTLLAQIEEKKRDNHARMRVC